MNKNAGKTNFSIAPFSTTEEGPDVVVFPEFDLELLQVLSDRILDLDRFDEEDGPVEPNVQIGMEKWVERNIFSPQVEYIG